MSIKSKIPEGLKQLVRPYLWSLKSKLYQVRANISEPTGRLPIDHSSPTFVVVVGPTFDQDRPDATMTCRMGYCNAFEMLGIPYVIGDMNDLDELLSKLSNPFCMIFGSDYELMSARTIKLLKKYPKFVWVNPWFKESDKFFRKNGLDAKIWTWTNVHRKKILESDPTFVFTGTVESGLGFFDEWETHGVHVISLPLACDTSLYNLSVPQKREFADIRLAFVGGYWASKGRQIDRYLRPFEDDLVIYGYNKWPYKGYRGMLSREDEPSLYKQALISPTINEPSVRLLHGVINERVFKVLGSGGMTVVDAVPAYSELFSEEELIIPQDENEFKEVINELLINEELRIRYKKNGCEAVITRHTYLNRAEKVLGKLNIHIEG